MFSKKGMAAMVKTYMMLCIAGLVMTVCVLMVMYTSQGSESKILVEKVASSQYMNVPLRQVKGAFTDDKTNDSGQQVEENVTNDEGGDSESSDDDEYWLDERNGAKTKDSRPRKNEVIINGDRDIKDIFRTDASEGNRDAVPGLDDDDEEDQKDDVDPNNAGAVAGAGGEDGGTTGENGGTAGEKGGTTGEGDGTTGVNGDTINGANVNPGGKAVFVWRDGNAEGVQGLIRRVESANTNASHLDVYVDKAPTKPPRQCEPKNNIVMVKTHKCSSSTMQNILFRWGEDHNLTFALPKSGVYLGSPTPFVKEFVLPVNGGKYNILANHLRFNEKAIRALMPTDSVYITLLRNPATQYESMFTYYRFDGRYRVTLDEFLNRPRTYFVMEPISARHVGRNPMMFDVGLDARRLDASDPKVTAYIHHMSEVYDLVLIAEYFMESLILLKEKMCWTLDDIVFFNQNARSRASVKRLSDQKRQRILDWNGADYKMYQHFNRTLWTKIDAFGRDRMELEVARLEQKNAALSTLCIGGTKQRGDKRVYYPPGVGVKSFVLNSQAKGNQLCEQMTRPELTYISKLRSAQLLREKKSRGSDGIMSRLWPF